MNYNDKTLIIEGEKWERIKGSRFAYISSLGRVKTVNFRGTNKEKILKQNLKQYGGRTIFLKLYSNTVYVNIQKCVEKHFFTPKLGKKLVLKNLEKDEYGSLDLSIDNYEYEDCKEGWLIRRYKDSLQSICNSHKILLHEELLSGKRNKYIQKCRAECFSYLRNIGYNYELIAESFNFKSHRTVMYSIKKHCPYADKIKNVKL